MIGIKIGNEKADVYPNTKVSLELVNPIFNEDNLSPGSISYPFDMPAGEDSPKNSTLLGTPDVVENTEGFRKIEATLEIDDIPYKSGKLIVRGYQQQNKATTNFNFGVRATFGDDFKTRKLADVVAEQISIWDPFTHSPTIYKKVYIAPGAGAVTPYEIDVNGRTYSGATLSALAAAINTDTSEPRAVATYVASGATPLGMAAPYIEIKPDTNPEDPLSPLTVAFDRNGVDVAAFKWLVHTFDIDDYNDIYQGFYTANFEDPRFSFPAVKNDNPYGEHVNPMYFSAYYEGYGSFAGGTKVTNDVNKAVSGIIKVNDTNYGYNNDRPFLVNNVNSLQPFIRVRHVLDKIAAEFGFEYEGDFPALPDIDEMYLWNTSPLDVAMDFIGEKKFVFYRSSFNLKELVPADMTVREFFMALQSRYNLSFDLNERNGNMIINMREPYAKAILYNEITPMCGSIKAQEDLRVTGFRMICDRESTNDLHYIDQLEIDTPQDEIKLDCKGFRSVIASQKIGSKFGLQVFYMKLPSNGGTGVASGDPFSGTWKEKLLDGENGIYEYFWKYWLYFQQRRRSITLPVAFPFAKLNDFVWSEKYRFDRNNYMVKKINVDIGPADIGVSSVELYSMY